MARAGRTSGLSRKASLQDIARYPGQVRSGAEAVIARTIAAVRDIGQGGIEKDALA